MSDRIEPNSDISSFINHTGFPSRKSSRSPKGEIKKTSFSHVMDGTAEVENIPEEVSAPVENVAELQTLFDSIFAAGRELIEKRSYSTALAYREQVKRFLAVAVPEAYQVRVVESIQKQTRRRYALLEQVNAAVSNMIDALGQGQQDALSLLRDVGKINGMLIDLMS